MEGSRNDAARAVVDREALSGSRTQALRTDDGLPRAPSPTFVVGQALAGGRFRVLGRLGAGGMGAVYEAEDRDAGSVVAIKTLLRFDADGLYHFKREFRALADLEHPNLIRLGELCCEGDTWFFTMERVSGVDWLSYVRPMRITPRSGAESTLASMVRLSASRKPDDRGNTLSEPTAPSSYESQSRTARGGAYDEPRLRDALRQLVLALVTVHRSGRVHRDVKPSNVKVTEDGRVVLLDFGLVTEHDPGTLGEDGGRGAGTPVYMAPEQAAAEVVGPPADLFAVGTMLFQALTGELPWTGPSGLLLAKKIAGDGPSPRSLAPDVPDDLDALCTALLRRDPAQRPTGEDVLRALEQGPSVAVALPELIDAPLEAAPFVGRERELEELARALADAKARASVSVLVHGEPGMGKTALVRRFLDAAAEEDPALLVLSGRCYEQESLPFKAFDAIIDALSRRLLELDEDEGRSLLRGGVRFLATMFPVLRRVMAVERLAPASQVFVSPDELRAQAFHELKSLLGALAERRTVVLFIDDLQWADAESLDLLRELRSPPDAPPCLVVATVREGQEGQLVGAAATPAAVEHLASFRRVRLGGLSEAESRSLVAALAGSGEAPAAEMGRLYGEAAGHPLFLAELSRFARSPREAPAAGLRLEDVLWQRIASLDESSRRILELSALAGIPVKSEVLARASDVESEIAFGLLARLRAAQLVRVTRRGASRLVEPFHDRVREAIAHHLHRAEDDATRAELEAKHLRLGRALLEGTAGAERDASIFTIVLHLARGARLLTTESERRTLAELELAAGHVAKTATAYEQALGYFRAGLSRLPADDAWTTDYTLVRDLSWGRVEAEYLAGRREDARAHFEELLPRLRTLAERVDLFVTKVDLDTAQRRFEEAIGTAYRALAACGETLPAKATPVAVLREYLSTRWHQAGRPPEAILELPTMTDETKRLALKILIALAPPAYFFDTPLLSVTLMRIAGLSYRYGVSDLSAYGFAGYGLVLTAAFGQAETGYAFGKACIELDRRFAGQVLGSKLHFIHGVFLAPWVRPFREAQGIIERGIELGRALGDVIYEAYNAGKLATMTLYEGRALPETTAALTRCLSIAEKRNDVDMAMVCSVDLRFCAALQKEDGPRTLFEDGDLVPPAGISDQRTPIAIFFYFLLSAELAFRAGDARRCLALLAEVNRRQNAQFGIVSVVDYHLFRVLAWARLARSASFLRRIAGRFAMASSRRAVERMARRCPDNFQARARLARAAELGAHGAVAEALATFRTAVQDARRYGDRKHEALAWDLAARLAEEHGRAEVAELRSEAAAAYARWRGAHPSLP